MKGKDGLELNTECPMKDDFFLPMQTRRIVRSEIRSCARVKFKQCLQAPVFITISRKHIIHPLLLAHVHALNARPKTWPAARWYLTMVEPSAVARRRGCECAMPTRRCALSGENTMLFSVLSTDIRQIWSNLCMAQGERWS